MGKPIVFFGFGDLAERAAAMLQEFTLIGVARGARPTPAGVTLRRGAAGDPELLASLVKLQPAALVVTLTPDAMTDVGYQRAYVDNLAAIIQAFASQPPQLLLFASSTSVYGQDDGSWVDEASATEPGNFMGRRLLEAEQLLDDAPFATCVLRFSGIYGPGRDHMILSVRDGSGGDERYTNRIHQDDAAAALVWALRSGLAGKSLAPRYLVTDSEPAPSQQVCAYVAEQLGLDSAALKPRPGNRGGNKRCANARLLEAGFNLRYPSYRQGYARAQLESTSR